MAVSTSFSIEARLPAMISSSTGSTSARRSVSVLPTSHLAQTAAPVSPDPADNMLADLVRLLQVRELDQYPARPVPATTAMGATAVHTRRVMGHRCCIWEGAGSADLAREVVRVGADALVPVQRADRGDVLAREPEVEDVEVLPDPVRVDGLGEEDIAALNVPAQHDLSRGLAGLAGDPPDHRLPQQVAAARER